MAKVSNQEASILTNVTTIASIVGKLVNEGLSVAKLAEKVVSVLDPALKPDLDILVEVLQEAQKLLGTN